MKIGDMIRSARERTGLSLQALSESCGMSKGYLHDIEKGVTFNVGIITAVRLSVALGIPVSALAAAALESLESKAQAKEGAE